MSADAAAVVEMAAFVVWALIAGVGGAFMLLYGVASLHTYLKRRRA